ncbi:MAG: hypothetical protein AAF668_03355 [Pseudomonadota bacterium]
MVSGAPDKSIAARSSRKPKSNRQEPWARLGIGVIGGYAVTTLASVALTDMFPIPRGERTIIAVLIGAIVYTVLLMRVFAVSSWVNAARDMGLVAVLSTVIIFVARIVRGG